MFYATDTLRSNGSVELHVFKSKRDRDAYTLAPLLRTGDCSTRRDATANDAMRCNPWSLVLHDTTLAELDKLPSWIVDLVGRSTTWFASAGTTHVCLV